MGDRPRLPGVLVYVLFVVGLGLLWKGADFLVEGGVSLARHLGVSSFVVALTVVSFGTTVPELAVNVTAAIGGSTGLALGNALGSYVANTLLILGLAALVAPTASPVRVRRQTVRVEIPAGVAAAVVVGLLANGAVGELGGVPGLGRLDALVLLALLGVFLWYVFQSAEGVQDPMGELAERSIPASLGIMAVGLAGLVVGGRWIVAGALELSRTFGLSEAIVGAGILAVGTSLPELATSLVAVRNGKADLAVGNVVGANLLNLCWVLPVTALIEPIPLGATLNLDLGIVVASSLVLLLLLRRGESFERWHGAALIVGYAAYVASLVLRV